MWARKFLLSLFFPRNRTHVRMFELEVVLPISTIHVYPVYVCTHKLSCSCQHAEKSQNYPYFWRK